MIAVAELDKCKMSLLSWTQYRERLKNAPLVILPVGALEQHGPHLPMACDALLSEAIALRLAAAIDGMVMPPLSYGYKSQERSGGGQCFPGTTSLDGITLIHTLRDILRELFRHGATNILVLNGHVENQWFLTEGIDLALREIAQNQSSVRVSRCEYWNYTPQHVLERIFDGPFPGVDLEHAALIETSMMLALYPHLVDISAFPEDILADFPGHDTYPQRGNGVPVSGVLAPLSSASAEKGWLLIDSTVEGLVAAFKAEGGT
jgi:creatinine amidohydrolase